MENMWHGHEQSCSSRVDMNNVSPILHQRGCKIDCQGDNAGCRGNDRRVLLDITVEIEGQCAEHIEMKEGDTAESVAKKFCRRQCLPDLLVAPLTDHIVSNIISIRVLSEQSVWRAMCLRGESAKHYQNYGELLYTEGLRMKEKKARRCEQQQRDNEARELAQMTATPEISKRARNMKWDHDVYCRLQVPDKSRQDQLQELRNEIWESKLAECTFRPAIHHNRRYQHDNDKREKSCNRFLELFQDAEIRHRRQEECARWYPIDVTFQPTVSKSRCKCKCTNYEEGSVFHRLWQHAAKLNRKKDMRGHVCQGLTDPLTGQRLFQPLVGRKSHHDRNPRQIPIGEFLYRLRFSIDRQKEELLEQDLAKRKELAESPHMLCRSKKLLGRIRERGFKAIFACLDNDKDGRIKLSSADLQHLDADVVEDVNQVMKMTGSERVLNFDDFVNCMLAVEVPISVSGTGPLELSFATFRT
ncbi:unnamed protein product [Sphagnum jensenii]